MVPGGNFRQGKFVPLFPEKCINNGLPTYRSSYEKRFMNYLDTCKNIIRWGSETHIVEYFLETDGKVHRYHIDFYMEVLDIITRTVKKYLVEVKPYAQTIMPEPPKIQTKQAMQKFEFALKTAIMNKNKWQAAERYAKSQGMEFKVISERELGLYVRIAKQSDRQKEKAIKQAGKRTIRKKKNP